MNTVTVKMSARRTPWHLWVVGILTLLWDGSGAYTILLAQAGKLADVTPGEATYYATQPLWFVTATDIALFGAIAAALALLLRSRFAVLLFSLSLLAIVVTDIFDLASGRSRALLSTGAMAVTALIFLIALLQLWYAVRQRKRSVLR